MYNEFPTIIGILGILPFYAFVFALICMYLCIRFEWIGELFSNLFKLIFRKKEPLLLPAPPQKMDWSEVDQRLAKEKEKEIAINSFIEFIEALSWKWENRTKDIISIVTHEEVLKGTVSFEQYNPNAPGLKVTEFATFSGKIIRGMEKKETPFFMLKSYYDNIVKQHLTKLETIAQNHLLKGETFIISPEDYDEGKTLNNRELEAFCKALEDNDYLASITDDNKIELSLKLEAEIAPAKSVEKTEVIPVITENVPSGQKSFEEEAFEVCIDSYFGIYEQDGLSALDYDYDY